MTGERVVIYGRKSNVQEKAASGKTESVELQLQTCHADIEKHGRSFAREFLDDMISGATYTKLAGRRAMLAAAERGEFEWVYVSHQDRFGRNAIEQAYTIMLIINCGVRIWSHAKNDEIKLDTTMDATNVLMTALFAQAERQAASERGRIKAVGLAQGGHVTGGRIYGYDIVGPKHAKRRVVNHEQATVLRRIFQAAAAGAGNRQIRDMLNGEGVPGPRKGKQPPYWQWMPTGIRDIVKNPAYVGQAKWGTTKNQVKAGYPKAVAQPETEWIMIPIPRIIDDDLWAAVQARREQRKAATPRSRRGTLLGRTRADDLMTERLLSGFLQCGVCGGRLRILAQSPRGSATRRWWGCATRYTRGPTACTNRNRVREAAMDAAVLQAVGRALSPAHVEQAAEALLAQWRERSGLRDQRREQLARDRDEAKRRVANLVEAVTRGDAPEPLIEALKVERDRQKTLQSELDALDAAPAPTRTISGRAVLPNNVTLDWSVQNEPQLRAMVRGRMEDALMVLMDAKATRPARGMLRRALGGGLIACVPEGQGFRFRAPLDFGRLVEGSTGSGMDVSRS